MSTFSGINSPTTRSTFPNPCPRARSTGGQWIWPLGKKFVHGANTGSRPERSLNCCPKRVSKSPCAPSSGYWPKKATRGYPAAPASKWGLRSRVPASRRYPTPLPLVTREEWIAIRPACSFLPHSSKDSIWQKWWTTPDFRAAKQSRPCSIFSPFCP